MIHLSARSTAATLAGELLSSGSILAPGPGHSARDRSLQVTLDPAAPDGFRVHSFSGDDWRACRDHVRDRLGIDPDGWKDEPGEPMRRPPEARPAPSDFALRLWHESVAPEGTPVETYLKARNLEFSMGEVLRWHPRMHMAGTITGAMVALVRDIRSNDPKAIHRTALDHKGQKRSEIGNNGRLALGPCRGGAVKLTDDTDVTTALGIGEGLETTLSMNRLPGLEAMPVWALLGTSGLKAFPALPGIEGVFIAVDHDDSGAGDRAAREAADRLVAAGIEVTKLRPRLTGRDLNDVTAGEASRDR